MRARLAVVVVALVALAVLASARPPAWRSPEPPVDAPGLCGRARAARLAAAWIDPHDDPAARETDLLHVDLALDVDTFAHVFTGDCRTRLRVLRDGLTRLRFRLDAGFAITAVTIDGEAAPATRVDTELVEVAMAPRAYDEELALEVRYRGVPGGAAVRFTTENGSPAVATLSEPYAAHEWWPVKDDNRDKLTATLAVTVPEPLSVVANGVLASVESAGAGRRRFRWTSRYPIAPYLVAFSAADYRLQQLSFPHVGGAMPVLLYLYPRSDSSASRAAWGDAVLAMLGVFGEMFGAYPFLDEKYSIYQFPWGGGMEHQTATGQGGGSAFAESLTAHELAHQWWGDDVTCADWHEIWLNEGFATYSEALWEESRYGPAGLEAAMQVRRPLDPSGSVWVPDTSSPARVFSTDLSYRKGAWVLHMLRAALGDEAFFTTLARYRQRHAGATATTEDLRAVAEDVSGQPLEWFFDQWVYGSGAPQLRWGWRETRADGRAFLELLVEQTQSGSTAFVLPLDLAVDGAAGSQRVRVWNDARSERLIVEVQPGVTGVVLDPDGWLLTRSRTAAPFAPGGPRLVAAEPAPGARVTGVERISLTFHQDVSPTAGDFSLTDGAGRAEACALGYDEDSRTATLTPAVPLPPGSWRLVVRDSLTGVASGLPLDGEVAGPLPSGDGVAGGDAVLRFTVAGPLRTRLP